ncbi:MAG: hypothetical protein JRG82_17595, partial [Deltaproteobacteria bacterium]|nr:hypothetical protein [Deltaproteobacteria bacterium]
NLSPLMRIHALKELYALDPRMRIGSSLIHGLIARLGHGLAHDPLESGFPPQDPGPGNAWRFVPGLFGMPGDLWRRLRARARRRGRSNARDRELVRALCADGASDYLRPHEMASAALFDARALEAFLDTARTTGDVSPALLGRLIAVEFALRRT